MEVAADAPDGTLAALRDALRTGPAGARVSHVDDVPTAADPPLSDVFLILR